MRYCLHILFLLASITANAGEEHKFQLSEICIRHYQDTLQVDSPIDLQDSWLVTNNAESKYETADWYEIKVPNSNVKWVIEAYDFRTADLSLYYYQAGEWKTEQVGWSKPYDHRPYDLLNLVLDVPIDEDIGSTYFVKVYDPYGANQEVFLHEQQSFTNYAINENTILGFFYGILIIIALYNFILFIYLKDRSHLFLVLYILASVLFSFQSDGFGFKYLWSNRPEWNDSIDYFWTPLLFTASYILYALNFIQVRKTHPKLYQVLLAIAAISITLTAVEFFLPFDLEILSWAYIIPITAIFSSSVYLYTIGFTFNRFFIVGNALVLLSLVIHSTGGLGLEGIISTYSFEFAVSAELLTLSLALADKVRFIKTSKEEADQALILQLKDNEILSKKVNLELEEKVSERTQQLKEKTLELEGANEKLKALTVQLNDVNEKLDYDNWKLNKSVQEATHERFRGKEVSIEEFNNLFPDELTCLRLLHDLKWEQGYTCRKCGHANCKEDKRSAKKCSKCGHVESATANTLLHRVKIPLPKAFYLTYVSFMGKSYTNTVRRFLTRIDDFKSPEMNLWEDFLLAGT